MQLRVETGLQLFTRLRKRSCLTELDKNIFFNGVRYKDIIEINGNTGSGKTLLMSKLLAKCILPERYERVHIDGFALSVVLLNTDCHFQVSKLIKLMGAIVKDACVRDKQEQLNNETVNAIIDESLNRLKLINCYNLDQFIITLHNLEDLLFCDEKIAVLAIDSVSSFYWQSRENANSGSTKPNMESLMNIVQNYTSLFNIVTIYTKINNSIRNDKILPKFIFNPNATDISYKVHLYKSIGTEKHFCVVSTSENIKKMNYVIHADDIEWIKNKN